ncbi:hypothetical protein [Polyangium spumosum]|uniref:Uncharacterized protein n=1 Tax=Polyangium spumosum TaxID=889282 RepID=A0A6N7PEJ1_9BACT|nr:hypothetical protein [Polyangium spumosum]MRG90379.1 hypothetical protein [Polyangium spumosum]
MRKDMFELIIERPRYDWGRGRGAGKGRYATRMKADPEAAPLKEGMKYRGQTRVLSENFAPLRRFLARRVGRPWDAVWSEIRAHLSPSSAVQKHVFDHVLQFVERNPVMIDGVPHSPEGNGPRRDVFYPLRSHGPWQSFYVCPRTGLLCSVAEAHLRRKKRSRGA